jgi:hypothetical protein
MRQLLWFCALTGLVAALIGFSGYLLEWPSSGFPHLGWAALGVSLLLVSGVALLDRYQVIDLWQDRHSQKMQIRERIEAYYAKGQEIYRRLGTDSEVTPEQIRDLVSDEWVQPVTEYLRGTLGDRKALYFLNVTRGSEPDDAAIRQFGYQRALARARIMDRLERLRQIAGDLQPFR